MYANGTKDKTDNATSEQHDKDDAGADPTLVEWFDRPTSEAAVRSLSWFGCPSDSSLTSPSNLHWISRSLWLGCLVSVHMERLVAPPELFRASLLHAAILLIICEWTFYPRWFSFFEDLLFMLDTQRSGSWLNHGKYFFFLPSGMSWSRPARFHLSASSSLFLVAFFLLCLQHK